MTVVHGAAAVVGGAGGGVPLTGEAVEELILTNSTPLVVEVNVLKWMERLDEEDGWESERWRIEEVCEIASICVPMGWA